MNPRFPLLLSGAVALVAGLYAGVQRMGVALPVAPPSPADHGPLMVSGFLGTVIALERAAAMGRAWAYFAPLLSGASALVFAFGPTAAARPVGWLLSCAAGAVLVAVYARVLAEHGGFHHWVMAAGAAAWLGGSVGGAIGRPVHEVVPALSAFLVLTIAGERLELNRVLPPGRWTLPAFAAAAGLVALGVALSFAAPGWGARLVGVGHAALGAWLLRFDVARRNARQRGLVRYVAVALLAGYGWLVVGGALAIRYGNPVAGPLYDAVLHSVLVGFVFSMIFAHAPIIVPAVLGIRILYGPSFYGHVALLHLALLARVAGDLVGSAALRIAGGVGGAVAILLFIAVTASRSRRQARAK